MSANAVEPRASESGPPDALIVLTEDGVVVDEFNLSEATNAQLERASSAGTPVVSDPDHPVITPRFQMGVGRGLYIYLNNKDAKAVLAGGVGAATALCSANPIAAVGCAVIASLIVANLPNRVIPKGHCVELKYAWAPGWNPPLKHVSTKVVKRSC